MALIRANGIDIDYAECGVGEALVLIRGLGTQRIQWPPSLLEGLAAKPFRVISFDNRDAGLSHKCAAGPEFGEVLAARARGEAPAIPYTLADMADDVIGLIDALSIERAHVVGISLGGMIVQHLGIRHGERLLSMTSIMSSSGAPGLPSASDAARQALVSQPRSQQREDVVAHTVATSQVFASPGYPTSDAALREMAERCFDRCYCPAGAGRQMLAALCDSDRADSLASIRTPALVIHGEDDPLVPIECGRDTAARIPGAHFQAIPGMGHDVAEGLVATLVEQITQHARAATR